MAKKNNQVKELVICDTCLKNQGCYLKECIMSHNKNFPYLYCIYYKKIERNED